MKFLSSMNIDVDPSVLALSVEPLSQSMQREKNKSTLQCKYR